MCLILAGCSVRPEPTGLALPIDRRCTTCDDFIACSPTDATAETLYHLQPKSFLAQVATIFDYLLQAVWQRAEDERAVRTYTGTAPVATSAAAIDLVNHRIRIGDLTIDQTSGNWLASDGGIIGQCRLLPLAEGRDQVKDMTS